MFHQMLNDLISPTRPPKALMRKKLQSSSDLNKRRKLHPALISRHWSVKSKSCWSDCMQQSVGLTPWERCGTSSLLCAFFFFFPCALLIGLTLTVDFFNLYILCVCSWVHTRNLCIILLPMWCRMKHNRKKFKRVFCPLLDDVRGSSYVGDRDEEIARDLKRT